MMMEACETLNAPSRVGRLTLSIPVLSFSSLRLRRPQNTFLPRDGKSLNQSYDKSIEKGQKPFSHTSHTPGRVSRDKFSTDEVRRVDIAQGLLCTRVILH